jgi:hypothetical protein
MFVLVIELLVNLPSPIPELQHASLPPKCCKPKGTPQLFLLPLFSPLDSVRQLLSFYFRIYKVTMLESTNATGEGKMQV